LVSTGYQRLVSTEYLGLVSTEYLRLVSTEYLRLVSTEYLGVSTMYLVPSGWDRPDHPTPTHPAGEHWEEVDRC
jgi:hypothetical protein